jgi:hypothetical protein
VHISIRKDGHDSNFGGRQVNNVDWTRPNRWFGEFHPNTYLEGSMYPAPGDYRYRLSLDPTDRTNWPDDLGSDYSYTTQFYSVYYGFRDHPGFGPGEFEIATVRFTIE